MRRSFAIVPAEPQMAVQVAPIRAAQVAPSPEPVSIVQLPIAVIKNILDFAFPAISVDFDPYKDPRNRLFHTDYVHATKYQWQQFQTLLDRLNDYRLLCKSIKEAYPLERFRISIQVYRDLPANYHLPAGARRSARIKCKLVNMLNSLQVYHQPSFPVQSDPAQNLLVQHVAMQRHVWLTQTKPLRDAVAYYRKHLKFKYKFLTIAMLACSLILTLVKLRLCAEISVSNCLKSKESIPVSVFLGLFLCCSALCSFLYCRYQKRSYHRGIFQKAIEGRLLQVTDHRIKLLPPASFYDGLIDGTGKSTGRYLRDSTMFFLSHHHRPLVPGPTLPQPDDCYEGHVLLRRIKLSLAAPQVSSAPAAS